VCGVCGIVSLSGEAVDPAVVEAMSDKLVHRGPDSAGLFADPSAALGARRLSIIDLEGGDQPIGNENGRIQVVQNGEIYNHEELRERLERNGHVFRTRCDTEVLVHLYEERGPSFVEELRGMFAIAIWDRLEHRLVLARDRFGIKPLYYRAEQGTLSFASELKALLAVPGVSREIDLDALEAFMAFNSIPAPLTIFREARKLPAGHLLIADASGVSIRRYARGRSSPRRRAASRGRTSRRSCASACATRSGPISSRTCRSASFSPAASTRPRSPHLRRARARTASAHSRSGSKNARSTSSSTRASSPTGTRPTTTS
jgi:asparagine synthase (glutamine-hydrolysing)